MPNNRRQIRWWIRIDNLAGEVQQRTASGRITVTNGPATLKSRSSSGQINLAFSKPISRIEAESVAGHITLLVPEGDPHRALTKSTTGNVNVDVDTAAEADAVLDLRSTTGDITVGSLLWGMTFTPLIGELPMPLLVRLLVSVVSAVLLSRIYRNTAVPLPHSELNFHQPSRASDGLGRAEWADVRYTC